jgi:hypothetical protein
VLCLWSSRPGLPSSYFSLTNISDASIPRFSLVETGSYKLFVFSSLEPWSSQSLSQLARITSMRLCIQMENTYFMMMVIYILRTYYACTPLYYSKHCTHDKLIWILTILWGIKHVAKKMPSNLANSIQLHSGRLTI